MDSKPGTSWLFGLTEGLRGRQGPCRWNECEKVGEPGIRGCILPSSGMQNGNPGLDVFLSLCPIIAIHHTVAIHSFDSKAVVA